MNYDTKFFVLKKLKFCNNACGFLKAHNKKCNPECVLIISPFNFCDLYFILTYHKLIYTFVQARSKFKKELINKDLQQ